MKKEIRQVSDDGKQVQITIADERWYLKIEQDDDGKVISQKEYPSVTWIADHYPKGIGFYKWLADKGWDEAEGIKNAAGNKGSKVHQAVEDLLLGNEVTMEGEYRNAKGDMEELTLEEYECLMSFDEWFKEAKPKILQTELTLFNEEHNYAGTADFICEIDGERTLIDFKTSAQIWPSHKLQISAYKHALPEEYSCEKTAILQLGYRKNKYKKWKLTPVEDHFDLFLASQLIWKQECSTVQVFKKDYPTSLKL